MSKNNMIVAIIVITFLVVVYGFNNTISKNNNKSKIENYTIAGLFGIAMVSFFYALTYLVFTFYELNIIIPSMLEGCMSPNEEGDAVGGTMNAIIGICISSFTALAFYAQYEANKQVQDQFLIQKQAEIFNKLLEQKQELLQDYTFKDNKGISAFNDAINSHFRKQIETQILKLLQDDLIERPETIMESCFDNDFILMLSKIKKEKDKTKRRSQGYIKQQVVLKNCGNYFYYQIPIEKRESFYINYMFSFVENNQEFVNKYIKHIVQIINNINRSINKSELKILLDNNLRLSEISFIYYTILSGYFTTHQSLLVELTEIEDNFNLVNNYFINSSTNSKIIQEIQAMIEYKKLT